MIVKIKSLANRIGIDGAIAITVLTRAIQGGGGLLTIVLIARYLSTEEQGYFYTFGSILAIQVFFELGLSSILTQYAAHEFAHLKISEDFVISGSSYYKSRLASLLRFCVRTFAIISFILFFVLLIAGYYFFSTYNKVVDINWQLPWVVLCATTALNLFIDPLLAFFDGLGKVKDMATVRLIQKSSFILLVCIFFMLDFKLYSSALASLVSILINYVQIIFTERYKLLKAVWLEKGEDIVNYMKEIFPFQWRIALSWISGYFIFSLFSPVLFATEGAKVSGQMGMSLAALMGISTITMSWINTKVPLFSGLVATRKYDELDIVFNKTLRQVIAISIVFIGIFLITVIIIQKLKLPVAERFLPIVPLSLLSLTIIINQFVFAWAAYLRAHKREPFLMPSIVVGVLCCASTFFLGHRFGLNGMVIGYTTIMSTVSFIWAYFIFKRKRIEWHNPET